MAARSVGSIEVTVDADTSQLKAQLKRAGKTGGEAAAAEIEKALDDVEADVEVGVDKGSLRKTEQQIDKSLDDLLAEVGVQVERGDLARVERQIEEKLDDLLAEVGVTLDDVEAQRAEADLERRFVDQIDAVIGVDLQEQEARRAEREIENIVRGIEATIAVSPDMASVQESKARIDANMDSIEADVEVDIDRASKAKADALLERNFDETGSKAGTNFGKSFGGSMSDGKWIAAAVLSMGDALAAGLSGVTASATSVISSAISALGGAAGAAAPLVAGLGTALASGIVGAQGFGDALSVVNDEFALANAEGRPMNRTLIQTSAAFRNLAPEAQAAAMAFADIRDELGQLREDVQAQLFRGFADEIASMADETIPDMSAALQIAADSVNEFGRQMAGVARETNFADMMGELDPALDDAFDGMTALAQATEPFLRAAAPAAERLAEMFERAAEQLRDFVSSSQGQNRIQTFLDEGIDSLRAWGALLQSTGDLLATIFEAGADSGDGFVIALNNIIERWDGWLESARGQDALTEFFQSGKDAIAAFQPVLDGLKEAFDILVTPDTMGRFEGLGEALGQAIPVIAEIINLFGQLGTITAISTLLAAISPLVEALGNISPALLEIVGAFGVVVAVGLKMKGVIQGISLAMKAMTLTSGIWLAIAATVAVAMVAYDSFSSKSQEVEERTRELTTALQNNVDAMILSGDGANSAATGMDALNKSIAETGEGGEKLMDSFATINRGAGDASLGIEDTTRVLMGMREEGDSTISTLQGLAEGYGLPADAAKELANIVNSTDENMSSAQGTATVLGHKLTDLADATGIPRDELVKLYGAMEETQDQAENTNFDKIAQQFLDVASTGTEAEQALLSQAQAAQKSGDIAAGVVPLYEEYVRLLDEHTNAADDSAAAILAGASSYEIITGVITEATAAHEAEAQALKESQRAAMDTYRAQEQLKGATERAAGALAVEMGMTQSVVDGLIGIGNASRDASTAADALTSAFNILFGTGLTAQESFDAFYTSINDLNEKLKETGEEALPKVGSGLEAVFGTTEAALGFRDAMRSGVDEMLAYAIAATADGVAAGEMNTHLAAMRNTLVETGAQFGISKEEVDGFITSLIGTPELVQTIVETPGMIDALLNAENLTLLYDAAGNPVITEFEAAGIDPAMADVEGFKGLVEGLNTTRGEPTVAAPTIPDVEGDVEGLQGGVDDLGSTTATPEVELPSADGVEKDIKTLQTALDKLGRTTATPRVQMPSYSGLKMNIDTLQRALDKLDRTNATPNVSVIGAGAAKTAVDNLDSAINGLHGKTVSVSANVYGLQAVRDLDRAIENTNGKTVTVTTNFVNNGSPGGMTGAMITGPRHMNVGERGYAEALVPLQLPLNRVDPSVRHFAELLRGDGQTVALPGGPGKVVNNYMTITPASADPVAVSHQIVNRAAVMASR